MNVFEFNSKLRDAIRSLGLARQALRAIVGSAESNRPQADVYVRLRDGTELPVLNIKVRGSDRIILETFADG